MLRLLSLLAVVSLVTGMSGMLYGSQESHAKSAVKKSKKPAAANLKVTKTEKKFSELDNNRVDRFDPSNDLHSSPLTVRSLRSH